MNNTPSNRKLLNKLQNLCEGTPYEFHFREKEVGIDSRLISCLRIRDDAPEYTPTFYYEDDTRFTGSIRIGVQTTSYGALAPEDLMKVASGLMSAAQLAKVMSVEIQLAGFRISRA